MGLRSLRSLTIAFLCLFLTVTALGILALHLATQTTIQHLADQRIALASESLAPNGTVIARDELARYIVELGRNRDTGDLGMVLTDHAGRQIAGNVRLTRPLPLGYSSMSASDHVKGLTHGRAYVREIGGGRRIAVFAETEPFDNYFALRTRIYLTIFGVMVSIVLCGLLVFRRMIGQRIVNMRRTVDAIIDGDLMQRVPTHGTRDEFDQQAEGFNRMLDRIGELMMAVRNVTNDISHELRTPLARLRNQLALLEQRGDYAATGADMREAIEQTDALLTMFSAILRIAEVESGSRRAGFSSLSLDQVVRETADVMDAVVRESGHVLIARQCDPVRIVGDRRLLVQMFINLIENALHHTPEGTRIEITIAAQESRVRIAITDNGPGIAAADRDQAMRHFGRLEGGAYGNGHGLGLPLVRAIARLHGGTMELEDANPGLAIFITLPLH